MPDTGVLIECNLIAFYNLPILTVRHTCLAVPREFSYGIRPYQVHILVPVGTAGIVPYSARLRWYGRFRSRYGNID